MKVAFILVVLAIGIQASPYEEKNAHVIQKRDNSEMGESDGESGDSGKVLIQVHQIVHTGCCKSGCNGGCNHNCEHSEGNENSEGETTPVATTTEIEDGHIQALPLPS